MTHEPVLGSNEDMLTPDEREVRQKKLGALVKSIMGMARFCFAGLFASQKPPTAEALTQMEQTLVTRVMKEVGPQLDIPATELNPLVARTAHQLVIAGDTSQQEGT